MCPPQGGEESVAWALESDFLGCLLAQPPTVRPRTRRGASLCLRVYIFNARSYLIEMGGARLLS